MSRSGTLQDALRAVDNFQRATIPSKSRSKPAGVAGHVNIEDSVQNRRERRRAHEDSEDSPQERRERRRRDIGREDGVEERRERRRGAHGDSEGSAQEKRERRRKEKRSKIDRKRSQRKEGKRRRNKDSTSEDDDCEEKNHCERKKRRKEHREERSDKKIQGLKSCDHQKLEGAAATSPGIVSSESVEPPYQRVLGPAMPSMEKLETSSTSKEAASLATEALGNLALPNRRVLGPAMPSIETLDVASTLKEAASPSGNLEAPIRRVLGPEMPSRELLEAASKSMEAKEAFRRMEEALANDPLIGPPPPAAMLEASSANDAERFEEVTRILAADVGDAYELLSVKIGVSANSLKKRYWKLSLLVHPDKCPHPLAQQAFMALNKAVKDLQDPVKRSEIDRRVEEKIAKEEYEADLKAQREAAQWRKLRGEEPLPGDAQLLQGPSKEQSRDEWMTALPPEKQVGAPPSQQNTFFSRTEKTGRGDASGWTDTPLEKAQKAQQKYLESYKQATLMDVEKKLSFEVEKAEKAASLMDQYNEKKRSRSLVEEHRRKSLKKQTKSKTEKSLQGSKQNDWAETHPWRPWDREKDLSAGRQTVKFNDEKFAGEGLKSRFASNVGPRKFL